MGPMCLFLVLGKVGATCQHVPGLNRKTQKCTWFEYWLWKLQIRESRNSKGSTSLLVFSFLID